VKSRERLSDAAYQKYFEHFRADRYDPRACARTARAAGMRHAVLTSKHHEGFCLWDCALTDYKVTNTPAGRDVVAEFVAAFRDEGLRIGLYHSLIDWHHPEFPIDELHPSWVAGRNKSDRHIGRYAEYLHGQVRELIERFANDVLWFDFSYPAAD
jgi:alpha-L-fucosidase